MGTFIEIGERAMIWLLIGMPAIALCWKGSDKQRAIRAAAAFAVVLLLGLGLGVAKIFLSAKWAHDHPSSHLKTLGEGDPKRE